MDAVLSALIAVAGTLLGSFSTYLFQSHATERAQDFARDERFRQEQMTACSAFAGALTELKRGVITLWFLGQEDRSRPEYRAVRVECDRLGAAAEAARFRVQLVSADAALMIPADSAFAFIGVISSSSDRNKLVEAEKQFEDAVKEFIAAAAARLRGA